MYFNKDTKLKFEKPVFFIILLIYNIIVCKNEIYLTIIDRIYHLFLYWICDSNVVNIKFVQAQRNEGKRNILGEKGQVYNDENMFGVVFFLVTRVLRSHSERSSIKDE